eukprot:Pgem_evm1s13106
MLAHSFLFDFILKIIVQYPQTVLYFIVLGWSAFQSFRKSKQIWPVFLGLGTIAVTWVYIIRWMIEYKRIGGNNLFDDAYTDVVLKPHFALSSQLLTWVIVATVWIHEANPCYLIF